MPSPIVHSRPGIGLAISPLPWLLLLIAAMLALSESACAGESAAAVRLPAGASADIPLYPGTAPGSGGWTWHEVVSSSPFPGADTIVRDVVHPTLVVFRPPNPKRATHTAVIVAPGGGFLWLEIDSEGYDVARALAAEGVTAIVLKYRLQHTPQGGPDLREELMKQLLAVLPRYQAHNPPLSPHTNPGVADGIAAVRYVREHAAELGVDPNRIGMIGFSAGGVVTEGTLLHGGPQSHLDFAGLIYGAFKAPHSWPADTPPLFLAVASDDQTGAAGGTLSVFESLRARHRSAELHVFEKGGHGFGMHLHGLTSDLWLKELVSWMGMNGFLT